MMKVYVGRWSELEMAGEGLDELAPMRAIAADCAEAAYEALGCPVWWWSGYFVEAEDPDLIEIVIGRPGVIFESVIDLTCVAPFARKVRWVPVDEVEAFWRAQLENSTNTV